MYIHLGNETHGFDYVRLVSGIGMGQKFQDLENIGWEMCSRLDTRLANFIMGLLWPQQLLGCLCYVRPTKKSMRNNRTIKQLCFFKSHIICINSAINAIDINP